MNKTEKVFHGDCLDVLKTMKDNSIDSVCCDPPYGLSKEPDINEVLTKWLAGEVYDHKHGGFMGKSWDSFVPHPDLWREVYRVLKPGGHALVFAGTRTQDLMTVSLRIAGFEVRDVIEWLYFSGFPKSHDVGKAFDKRAGIEGKRVEASGVGFMNTEGKGGYNVTKHRIEMPERQSDLAKQWDGWGTALKPAHEPIIVVRKPLIDADTGRKLTVADCVEKYGTGAINVDASRIDMSQADTEELERKSSKIVSGTNEFFGGMAGIASKPNGQGRFPANCITLDSDEFYSKYFNVTPQELSKKASKRDRNSDWQGEEITLEGRGNIHPTVKPIDLMAWLVRLVTPPNGTVLDPFAGSGSTLVAAKREGFGFVGVELTDEYIPIIENRVGIEARSGDKAEVSAD